MQTKRAKQFKALLAEEKRLMFDLKIEALQSTNDIAHGWDRWFWRMTPTSITQRLSVINNLYAKLGGEPKTLDDYRALLEV
jgi:hypothetical protein